MKISDPLRVLIIVVIFASIGGFGAHFLFTQFGHGQPMSKLPDKLFGWKYPTVKFPLVGTTSNQVVYSSIRDPGGIPQGLPVRLKIPVIGVDSAIEDALITPDGRMDVPSGSKNVAWFALGPHPGQAGSAVIGGHFGISNGLPFVFYKLDQLKISDKVYILNDQGDTLAFQVRYIKLFDRNADATTVFTSQDGLAHLNLITCEGIWNQVNGNYPQRRVVFMDAVASEGAAPASSIFQRNLSIGSQGADVVALQTFLEEKGFLAMPPTVAKGYFGKLTRSSVAKYQTSVGLNANGIFDSLTKGKLIPEIAIKPALPATALEPTPELSKTQTFVGLIKDLFGNFKDGLVTCLLIISIAFIIFKIIRLRARL